MLLTLFQLNLEGDGEPEEPPVVFLAMTIIGEALSLPSVTGEGLNTGSVVNEVLV